MKTTLPFVGLLALPLLAACAQPRQALQAPVVAQAAAPEREADEYTRYELLDPESARFRILFEVTATEPGATFYFNPIRKGSEASDESVIDLATSKPLPFEVVGGEEARASGLSDADLDGSYIRIRLPRPVPENGGVRLLIDKTYKDPRLLTASSIPAVISETPDGRVRLDFVNPRPDEIAVLIHARRR